MSKKTVAELLPGELIEIKGVLAMIVANDIHESIPVFSQTFTLHKIALCTLNGKNPTQVFHQVLVNTDEVTLFVEKQVEPSPTDVETAQQVGL